MTMALGWEPTRLAVDFLPAPHMVLMDEAPLPKFGASDPPRDNP